MENIRHNKFKAAIPAILISSALLVMVGNSAFAASPFEKRMNSPNTMHETIKKMGMGMGESGEEMMNGMDMKEHHEKMMNGMDMEECGEEMMNGMDMKERHKEMMKEHKSESKQ